MSDRRQAAHGAVAAAIPRSEEEMLAFFRDLVRTPSRTGEEEAAQRMVADRLRGIGLDVELHVPDASILRTHSAYVPTPYPYEGRPNVIGVWDAGGPGRSLILNGHIDVVGEGPREHWSHDPWGAEVVDGQLFGRGAYDMKSGLVAGLMALRALWVAGIELAGRVEFQSVIEEELGGGGTLARFLAGARADGMIVMEPHHLQMSIAHAGILYCRITVRGRGAHAGDAHTGINAIEKMNLICDALFALDQERAQRVRFPLFEQSSSRSCHLNVGMYQAGDWPSMVPARAELSIRIGFIPGETSDDIKQMIIDLVERLCVQDEWLRQHPPELTWFGFRCEPWYQNPNDAFVAAMRESFSRTLGEPVRVIGRPAACDSRFGTQFGVPSITFGPSGGNAHAADEWADLHSIQQCGLALANAVIDWCGVQ